MTNYLKSEITWETGLSTASAAAVGGNAHETADAPTVTITDVTLRAISGNASVTLGADEAHVYSMAAS